MTRTMRQMEACSSFVRIQHGCSRSEALFRSVDSVLDSLEPKFILKKERLALHSFITTKKDVLAFSFQNQFLSLYIRHLV